MAFMRLLPIRQSLGNFLSNYAPEVLVEGLEEIKIGWEKDMEHEGGKFLNWISRSLEQCGLDFKKIKIEGSELKKKSGHCLETEWKYKDHKYLKWTYCKESETAELKANFAKRDIKQVFRVKELSDDESLRAACFY